MIILKGHAQCRRPFGKQLTSDWKSWQSGRIADTADSAAPEAAESVAQVPDSAAQAPESAAQAPVFCCTGTVFCYTGTVFCCTGTVFCCTGTTICSTDTIIRWTDTIICCTGAIFDANLIIYDTCAADLVVFVTHKDAKSSICDTCAADLGGGGSNPEHTEMWWRLPGSGALTSSPQITNCRPVDSKTGAMVDQQVLRQQISKTNKDSGSVTGDWQGSVFYVPSLVAPAEAGAGGLPPTFLPCPCCVPRTSQPTERPCLKQSVTNGMPSS